jgi:hypothetical protein
MQVGREAGVKGKSDDARVRGRRKAEKGEGVGENKD